VSRKSYDLKPWKIERGQRLEKPCRLRRIDRELSGTTIQTDRLSVDKGVREMSGITVGVDRKHHHGHERSV
jgi:hypothetical protein